MSGQESNVVFLPVEDAARGEVAALWETLRQEADAAVCRDQALVRAMNSAVLMHASFGHDRQSSGALEGLARAIGPRGTYVSRMERSTCLSALGHPPIGQITN